MKTGLNPVHNPPEKKDSQAGTAVYLQTMGQPAWTPRDYAAFSKEGYVENAIAYRCIRLIADACQSIPFEVQKQDGTPVDDHPFYGLLAHPNPFEGTADVLDALYSFLLIAGNSYLEAVLIGQDIRELYVLRPDRMKVSLDSRGRPATYTYKVGSNSTLFKVPEKGQREILHIKNFHPLNDIYGLSSIEPAAFSIDVHSAAGSYNKALLDNSAKPSGALVITGTEDNSLTDAQFARLKSELEEHYTGTQNAGRPLMLEGGLDWRPMGMTPQDMEFIQGKNQSAREIALSFGVPPQLLGIPGDNTYSNYKEANVALYRQTVLPLITRVCQALSNFLTPTYGADFKLWFDIDQISGLVQEREDTWNRINSSTFLSINEKREAAGYGEVEGGDDVLIQSSLVPLNVDIVEEEPAEEPDEEAVPVEGDDIDPAIEEDPEADPVLGE